MEYTPDYIARQVAQSLSPEFAMPDLPAEVENILDEGVDEEHVKMDANTTNSIAALIVSIAQLAWAIYNDLTDKQAKSTPQIKEQLTARYKAQTKMPPETINKVIDHTLEKMPRLKE